MLIYYRCGAAAAAARAIALLTDHQFHWQDYSDPLYITVLEQLATLKDEGYITAIGLCNFDAIRTDQICTHLGQGVVVSNQVQVERCLAANS